ncbi:hypothetical protein HYX00_02750 [Candidatus Woesearchaeota archaeon]|nr:hypothetical protein [Candidatus Woesearchaeota archaeon]
MTEINYWVFGVWYEVTITNAYLWLCFSRIKGNGVGTSILKSILEEISGKYMRAYAKSAIDNLAVHKQLTSQGFKLYYTNNDVDYFEKYFK